MCLANSMVVCRSDRVDDKPEGYKRFLKRFFSLIIVRNKEIVIRSCDTSA